MIEILVSVDVSTTNHLLLDGSLQCSSLCTCHLTRRVAGILSLPKVHLGKFIKPDSYSVHRSSQVTYLGIERHHACPFRRRSSQGQVQGTWLSRGSVLFAHSSRVAANSYWLTRLDSLPCRIWNTAGLGPVRRSSQVGRQPNRDRSDCPDGGVELVRI